MKGFEISFETRTKDRILNAPMQRKEMRLPFPHIRPGYRWPAARVEDTDAAQRQKKRRRPHLAQSLVQPILRWRFHVAQKAERQMKLFLGQPAQAAQMRVERQQRVLQLDGSSRPTKSRFDGSTRKNSATHQGRKDFLPSEPATVSPSSFS